MKTGPQSRKLEANPAKVPIDSEEISNTTDGRIGNV